MPNWYHEATYYLIIFSFSLIKNNYNQLQHALTSWFAHRHVPEKKLNESWGSPSSGRRDLANFRGNTKLHIYRFIVKSNTTIFNLILILDGIYLIPKLERKFSNVVVYH